MLALSVDTVDIDSRPRRVRFLFALGEPMFPSGMDLQLDAVIGRSSTMGMKSGPGFRASLADRILSTICLVFDLRDPESAFSVKNDGTTEL